MRPEDFSFPLRGGYKLDEEDLDNYILPHPLIGKTTIREMLYFTIYHVQHHHKAIVDNSN